MTRRSNHFAGYWQDRGRREAGVPARLQPQTLLRPHPGTNCIKIALPGKSILGDYFQENMTSRRPFLLLRISFPGRPIFIQLPPAVLVLRAHQAADLRRPQDGPFGDAGRGQEHFKFPAKLRFESSVGAAVVGGVNSGTDQAPPSLLSFFFIFWLTRQFIC